MEGYVRKSSMGGFPVATFAGGIWRIIKVRLIYPSTLPMAGGLGSLFGISENTSHVDIVVFN